MAKKITTSDLQKKLNILEKHINKRKKTIAQIWIFLTTLQGLNLKRN